MRIVENLKVFDIVSDNASKPKVALTTGIAGQDGPYLAELLLPKGYEVHGIKRRASTFNTERLHHIYRDPHTPNSIVDLVLHSLRLPMSNLQSKRSKRWK